jgi:hypothetical protein
MNAMSVLGVCGPWVLCCVSCWGVSVLLTLRAADTFASPGCTSRVNT